MHKLLVVNRGEIARRVIRAARSLGIPTVAVFSDPDRDAPFVAEADTAVALPGTRAGETYLDQDKVLAAAAAAGATLIHPGYGFLAENAGFAARCAAEGLVFVGPKPEVIAAMGDKHQARVLAEAAGVPVLPGTGKLGSDGAAIAAEAARVGFPLLVKAAAGGGGIGMRLVPDAAGLDVAVASTQTMASRAFGDGAVYLERQVARARHVEVQVFGFGNGQACHLFERDCSLQRRHQKVIEEALAPNLPTPVRDAMVKAAVQLAEACRYDGAGTVEFLYDEERQAFFFLEMNTRIQVEHCVTEMVTGVDLVAAQIRHAMGEDLSGTLAQGGIAASGHAIEARIYAEDPARNFMPSPGRIDALTEPSGPGIRVESGIAAGSVVTPFYDPMLMKLIAHGGSRAEAIDRLDGALRDLVVRGIPTNIALLRGLLRHPGFMAGAVHTGFIPQELPALMQTAA